jgi:hypothetical protein
MDGEERTGRPTADDGNAIVVAEAYWLGKSVRHVEKHFRLAAKANQDAKETLCHFGMQKSLTRHI